MLNASTGTHEETKTIGIESVNNGKNYLIDTDAYAKYGHIEEVVDFSEVADAAQLLKLANIYMQYKQYGEECITVSAIDMHNMGNTDIPALNLLDRIRCISAPHNLDKTFPITEMTIPLDKPDSATYVLGK